MNNRKKYCKKTLIIGVVVALAALTGCNTKTSSNTDSATNNASDSASQSVLSGETTYTLLEADDVSIADYKGKVVVLNFWASWCPPCKAEMPDLNVLNEELKQSDDVVFLSINLTDGMQETKEKAEKYLLDNNFGFTVLLDTKQTLADLYRISSIPHTFILDREGNVADQVIGATTKEVVQQKIDAVLATAPTSGE